MPTWLRFPPARPTSVGNQSVMCSSALDTRRRRFSSGLWTKATPRMPPSQYVPWRHAHTVGTGPSGSLAPSPVLRSVLYLASSQRPVAASGEGLGAVVGGVDDDAVPVVSQLPQSVGDVPDRLVHRGHHGRQLPSGDVGHVPVGVDVGLGGLERSVNRLGNEEPSSLLSCVLVIGPPSVGTWRDRSRKRGLSEGSWLSRIFRALWVKSVVEYLPSWPHTTPSPSWRS